MISFVPQYSLYPMSLKLRHLHLPNPSQHLLIPKFLQNLDMTCPVPQSCKPTGSQALICRSRTSAAFTGFKTLS